MTFNPAKYIVSYDCQMGAGAFSRLPESDRAATMARWAELESAEARDAADMAFVVETLRAAGITMSVQGCGCCGSPSITFAYRGRSVERDFANFDTREGNQ